MSEIREDISRKILKTVKSIKTPITWNTFIYEIERTLSVNRICNEVGFLFDKNPLYTSVRRGTGVVYSKQRHNDEIWCDGKVYVIEAEYEIFTVGEGELAWSIISSYKPLTVKEEQTQ